MPDGGAVRELEGVRPSLIGARVPRVEDEALLSGRGEYIADVRLPGAVDVALVRSQLPHAAIRGVDVEAAKRLDGVIDVVCARDLEHAGVSPVPDFPDWARPVATYPLARDRVRYVGAPIAAVVANDRYLAEDAAELVSPDLERIDPVSSLKDGLAEEAPRLYDGWPDNRAVDYHPENPEADTAFEGLEVVRGSYYMQRHGAAPIECRGVVAEYRRGRLTVWTSTQFVHIARTMYSHVLGMPERDIRVIAPDVGGSFGQKAEIYPEEYLVAWLAVRLGRPVRWIEDRYENLISACQARDMRVDLEAAVHEDGRIEALRGTVWQDLGSGEMFPNGFSPAFTAVAALTGPYRIPHQKVGVVGVVSNRTPTGAYRGFGIPEGVWAMERLVDKIARQLGVDRCELRRRMIIGRDELPYVTASGARIDSGSHSEAFERVAALGREARDELRAGHADRPSVRIGMGVATYVEGVAPTYYGTTGHWTSQDTADVRFDADGGVTVAVGVAAYGQGLWTMVATIAAEEFGLSMERVRVVMGDTDTAPHGLGSWGSRSITVVGGALQRAADQIREKAIRIAAHSLEAAPEDLVVADGRFFVRGSPQRFVDWSDVARTALIRTLDLPPGVEPGLEARVTYDPPGLDHVPDARGRMNGATTYTNASHAAVVAVEVETGEVRVLRYLVVHDCGRIINPTLVEGQIFGGVAQGIGGTLYEHSTYDDRAQPQATTFMDYVLPTACEVPAATIEHIESPSPLTALGAKGAGEAGIIGPAPAIAAAVEDALEEFGIDEISQTPLTPRVIRRALRRATAARPVVG